MGPDRIRLEKDRDRSLAVIVLAAGEGRRFGGPKQMALVEGRPVLDRTMAAVAGFGAPQVVVLGAAAAEISRLPIFSGWTIELASGWRSGPGASLRAGLRRAEGSEAAMIVLGDLPWLRREAVERVVEAARRSDGGAFRAFDGGEPGHPVLIRAEVLAAARQAPDKGLAALLRAVELTAVDCTGLGVAADVDEPGDLTSPLPPSA